MKVLSYGAGVNSTAILALVKLGKYPMPERIIFCDTGAERPETYCYLKYMLKRFNIEIISRGESLYDYCIKNKVIPSRQFRWCSDKFKIQPMKKYLKNKEYRLILGIASDEKHRVKDINADYPLIEFNIDRNRCIELIHKVGWDIPIKSGCYFCPFAKQQEFIDIYRNDNDTFQKIELLEKNALSRNANMFLKGEKPIRDIVENKAKQELFDGFENYQHCLCKFD